MTIKVKSLKWNEVNNIWYGVPASFVNTKLPYKVRRGFSEMKKDNHYYNDNLWSLHDGENYLREGFASVRTAMDKAEELHREKVLELLDN